MWRFSKDVNADFIGMNRVDCMSIGQERLDAIKRHIESCPHLHIKSLSVYYFHADIRAEIYAEVDNDNLSVDDICQYLVFGKIK